ncbi:DUF7096 domain-containing protein [Halocatena pleomorpha]|uniref:Uncharacterized protein n=1 Tax=Halocatena pleomorpha TaxID=1785090 RepID=A0A3P3RBQ8_9EURY|nr:hypothetical protein [Halocatena pleomorpha]RRJ30764.1 hypothetical protein EIK79_09030 [Halocatena pleomorpha]
MRSSRIPVVGMIVLLTLSGIPPSVTAPLPTSAQQDGTGTVKHTANGSLSYLSINGSIKRNDTVMLSQDVGSAVSLETVKFKQEFEHKRIKAADENASNETAFTIAKLETIETRTNELRERQNKKIQQYNEGEIASKTFLRELALITSEADRIQVLAGYLTEYAENDTLARQANDIKQELYMFKGPVRTRIRSALNGDPTAPNRFFVRTSTAGIELGTIDDSGEERTYVRETYLDGARSRPDSPKELGATYMRKKVTEQYGISKDYIQEEFGVASFYRYKLFPPEYVSSEDGITHYVDRGSGNIVFERQKVPIEEERTVEHEPKTNRTEQLTLTQRTTFPGGYMYVRLTDPDGEPLNGTVSVDGRTVGTTAEDSLLMLQPSNGSTITGTVGSKNVSVTVGNASRQPPAPAGNP